MTGLEIDPVFPDFVAEVRGVALAKPLDLATVAQIERAIWKYGVLVFPDQRLTPDEHVAFASSFGPLYTGLQMKLLRNINRPMPHEAISDISNLDRNGVIAVEASAKADSNAGNRFWHTDAAYEHHPFRYSILQALAVVSWGGETQFADLRAAYDTLDDRTRELIADRSATFYSQHVRHVLGIDDSDAILRAYPPVKWPMVRMHPGSCRKVLWVDSKVTEISGMSLSEARALVQDLLEHACRPECVHTHRWSVDDLVMWDNRSVLHRGRRHDRNERREMRRVATVDDASSLGTGNLPSYVTRNA